MFGATMGGATKKRYERVGPFTFFGVGQIHGIRMLVSIILCFVTIFATAQIFKRPGRPRAYFVFKDESRDQ
jgi:hypothetical protein